MSSLRCTTMSTMPCLCRYSERWKPSGSCSRIVSWITRWPAKPISASRLGDVHVAEHRVTRGDAAGGRVGEHDDVRQPGFLEPAGHHRRLGHLHEAEDAFLHPRAARGGDHNVGAALGERARGALAEGFAHCHAHRAGHEVEVLHPDHRAVAVDRAERGGEGVLVRIGRARLLEAGRRTSSRSRNLSGSSRTSGSGSSS